MFVVAVLVNQAHGRIGDSRDQVIERYGKPVKIEVDKPTCPPDVSQLSFELDGLLIKCTFWNEKCCQITYFEKAKSVGDQLDLAGVSKLLEKNTGYPLIKPGTIRDRSEYWDQYDNVLKKIAKLSGLDRNRQNREFFETCSKVSRRFSHMNGFLRRDHFGSDDACCWEVVISNYIGSKNALNIKSMDYAKLVRREAERIGNEMEIERRNQVRRQESKAEEALKGL